MMNLYDRFTGPYEFTFMKHGDDCWDSDYLDEYVQHRLEDMDREEFLVELSSHLEDMFEEFKKELREEL